MQSIAQLPDGVHGLCSGKSNCMCIPKPEDLQGLPFLHALVLSLPKLYAVGNTTSILTEGGNVCTEKLQTTCKGGARYFF